MCLNRGSFLEVGTPVITPVCTALFIRELKAYAQKIKRYGESGSPCLIPLDGFMFPTGCPFTKIEYETVLMLCFNIKDIILIEHHALSS